MNPTLQDLYRFLVRMHQSERAASIDFERFMAGDTPDHVIAYCRRAVSAESKNKAAQAGLNASGCSRLADAPSSGPSSLEPAGTDTPAAGAEVRREGLDERQTLRLLAISFGVLIFGIFVLNIAAMS
jgi:hypothetical protein